jgi:hypothetical protein
VEIRVTLLGAITVPSPCTTPAMWSSGTSPRSSTSPRTTSGRAALWHARRISSTSTPQWRSEPAQQATSRRTASRRRLHQHHIAHGGGGGRLLPPPRPADLVHATMRARNYSIPEVDKLKANDPRHCHHDGHGDGIGRSA